uniref:Uncharacterized protein n=1 Tax=Arundo donax TaxID=35708 RepID=A0A0A9HCJ0_ARUDO
MLRHLLLPLPSSLAATAPIRRRCFTSPPPLAPSPHRRPVSSHWNRWRGWVPGAPNRTSPWFLPSDWVRGHHEPNLGLGFVVPNLAIACGSLLRPRQLWCSPTRFPLRLLGKVARP